MLFNSTSESSNHSHSRNATVITRLSGHGAHAHAHAVHHGSSRAHTFRSSPLYGGGGQSNGRLGARPSIVADGASTNSPVIQVGLPLVY